MAKAKAKTKKSQREFVAASVATIGEIITNDLPATDATDTLQQVSGRVVPVRDAELFARQAAKGNHRRILGLDIATNCGAAYVDLLANTSVPDVVRVVGVQWLLHASADDTLSMRLLRFEAFLRAADPDLIIYEEIKNRPQGFSRLAIAQSAASTKPLFMLCGVMLNWAEARGIPVQAIPISTLKKYATGSGVADKPAMVRAANKRFGVFLDPDSYESTGADNVADAMFLCAIGLDTYARSLSDTSMGATAGSPERVTE